MLFRSQSSAEAYPVGKEAVVSEFRDHINDTGKFSQKACNKFKVKWKYDQKFRADLLTKGFHPESFRLKLKLFQGAISLKLLEK